jgi:hypothetical protein
MNLKRIIPVALQVLAGILSLSAALFGGLSVVAGRHHAPEGLLLLFCIPLLLLLPFYCLSFFRARISARLQLATAIVFLVADFLVNMHACGSVHPCAGFARVAIASLLDPISLVPFMIAALQTLVIYMREWEHFPTGERRSI